MSMRKILSISVLAIAAAAFASATILFDDFNYPVGPLDGQNGGTGWAGAWVGIPEYVVASGSLFYNGLQQSGNRAQFIPSDEAGTNSIRTLSSLGSDGSTFWLSFLISVDGTLAQNTADFRIDSKDQHLYVGRELDDQANWSVEDGGSTTPYTQSSIPIVPGQALFVAIRFDQNIDPNANDTVTIYLNPTPALVPSATPGVPGMVLTDLNFNTTNVTIGLDGSAFPDPTTTGFRANYDPIRGGTTYFDVAPGISSAVPEPATWSLMAGGLAIFAIALRRRARNVTLPGWVGMSRFCSDEQRTGTKPL
jgi:hypothetical protein